MADSHFESLRRRTLVKAGALSAFGLTLPDMLHRQQQARAETAGGKPAKSCILLYMTGGPAQQETFDMKPKAPAAPRGEFRPIASNVPGIDVCELLPSLARQAHRFTVVRSIHHDQTFHGAGVHLSLTGFSHSPREPTPEFYLDRRDSPSIGAVVRQLRSGRRGLPSSVQLPYYVEQGSPFAGQDAGYLGARYDPHLMPYKEDAALPGILPKSYQLPESVSPERLSRRTQLLQSIDAQQTAGRDSENGFSSFQSQAVDILNASSAWQAFSIEGEQPQTIERYGKHKFGRSCLVARRLIEAGVSLVTVPWWPGNFDTHGDHFGAMKKSLLPPMDRAFAALLADLADRGLLEETLVVWTGEFGRTPALNSNNPAGRDHWPFVYTSVLAGGGIAGGRLYGSSDDIAAYPQNDPVHVRDFVATIYHALGFDKDTKVVDPTDRPHFVVAGQPVHKLF